MTKSAVNLSFLFGVLLAVGNAVNHRDTLQPLIDHALADARVDAMVVPLGKAEVRLAILPSHEVSPDWIIIENRSSNTFENVACVARKIEAALDIDSIRTVAAVVKWYHSWRAIMTLKWNLSVKARFFTLTYETEGIGRSDWWMDMDVARRTEVHQNGGLFYGSANRFSDSLCGSWYRRMWTCS